MNRFSILDFVWLWKSNDLPGAVLYVASIILRQTDRFFVAAGAPAERGYQYTAFMAMFVSAHHR